MKKHEMTTKKTDIPVTKVTETPQRYDVSPLNRIEREMLTTLKEMEHWFEDALHRPFLGFHRMPLTNLLGERRSGEFIPSIDLFEEGNELVVKAELAGIKRDDIKVELVNNQLTIRGEKRNESRVERKDYFRVEQAYGNFCRTLDLPEGIDQSGVKASYKDGMLEIRIPRLPEAKKAYTVPIEE